MQDLRKDLHRNGNAYWMLLPAIVLIFIFSYLPMYGITIAFKAYKPIRGIVGSDWVGFQYFTQFFSSPSFLKLLRNTLHISLYTLLIGFPAPILLALMINEIHCSGYRRVVQTITYMPYFISTVVICGILKNFLSYDGVFNAVRLLFGVEPISFLSNSKMFPSIIVWSGVWQNIGWNSVIYIAALSAIDPQLYEAARIDGCNRLGQTYHITLPGILPTIVILLILNVGTLMTVSSDKILLLYTPLTYETGDVFGTYVYRKGIRGGDYSYSTVVGLFQNIVNFLLLIGCNALSKKVTEESLW